MRSSTGLSGMNATNEALFSKSVAEKIQNWEKWRKWNVINTFWPSINTRLETFMEEEYASFFLYIAKTLKALRSHETEFASKDLESLLEIIQLVRENPSLTLGEIIKQAREESPDATDSAVCRSIELSIRLWLCLNVYMENSRPIGAINPRDSYTMWYSTQTVHQMVASQFPEDRTGGVTASSRFQIDESLTLANLKNICGVHIRWTSNLQDHLRLKGQRGNWSLSIYQHKIYLVNHHRERDSVIPKPVLSEALKTFDILIPVGDAATDKLLRQSGVAICGPYEPRRVYDLEEFKYWKSSLAQLLDLINGPPETLSQALRDTRNLAQWSTLWIAVFGIFVLTLLFGVLTTVYSIKQYRIAAASYDLSVKSFQLSLATACQQKTAPLPGFCD